MNAEIVSIGTELLLGEINDTNATWIAQQLKDIGVNLFYRSTVGDNEARITAVLKLAMSRADIVITTGGLGPTVDDMTRQGVASAVGQPLEFHEDLMREIEAKFARFNAKMTPNNRLQAMLPQGATVIDNPVGTAPSFRCDMPDGAIISLPGVPREMKFLMENSVLPWLRERAGTSIIKLRVLRTAAAGESWVGEQLTDLMQQDNPTVGTAAHSGFCDVRITAKAASEAAADAMLASAEAEIRKRIGGFIFGVDKEPLEGALRAVLREAGAYIALCETGTEGNLYKRLAFGSDLLARAVQFDTIAELAAFLDLQSEDLEALAVASAEKLLAETPARVVVSIVSRADGTVISVTDGANTRTRAYAYGGVDQGGPEWATGWGISMAWRLLREAAEKQA